MKIISTSNFKKAAKDSIQIVHTPSYFGADRGGDITAYVGVRRAANLQWNIDPRFPENAHIESVYTEKDFRGHGLAKRLVQEFVNHLKKTKPWVKNVEGEYMSRKMLVMMNQMMGKPNYIADNTDDFTDQWDTAHKKLPPDARESRDGSLDGYSLFSRHKLPSRINKKKLQRLKPWVTQPELPFDKQASAEIRVVTETNEEGAAHMLTQGLQPSFKPRNGPPSQFGPGRGIDHQGTYVAAPNAFSKGSFGPIRIYLKVKPEQLAVSPEQKQLGVTQLQDALRNEDGCVTVGYISPDQIYATEMYDPKTKGWLEPTKHELLERLQVDHKTPTLPTVEEYRQRLQPHADRLHLNPQKIEYQVNQYKMAPLQQKVYLALELAEIEG